VTTASSTPGTPDDALLQAVELIMRPLARLFLEQGLVYGTVEELLKAAYVRVALAEFGLHGEPPTDSRVSVLSGIHRKDVRRLRTPERAAERRAPALPFASEVVTRWISDPRYLERSGAPKVLPRAAPAPAPSFDALVTSISTDVRPRVLLDELVRLGVARLTGKHEVELLVGAFVPPTDLRERLFYFGRNLHDHLAAAAHNLARREPSMLENSVFSFELSEASIAAITADVRREWNAVLGRLIREIGALEERDRASGDTSRRLNVGIYFFHESANSPAAHGTPQPRRRPAGKSATGKRSKPSRRAT
jgi:hypothetical protein